MSQIKRSDGPHFQIRNHHAAECGIPPHIEDLRPNQYVGYFENQHGEQSVFIYDRDASQAIVDMGDAGWQTPSQAGQARAGLGGFHGSE